MSYLLLGCRESLAALFLISCFGKLRGRREYLSFISATVRLTGASPALARKLCPVVVSAEGAVLICLAMSASVIWGFCLAAILLGTFTTVLVRAIQMKSIVSCRCFGSSDSPIGGHHVVRNLVLIVVALLGLLSYTQSGTGEFEMTGIVTITLIAAIFDLVMIRLDDLLALF